MKLKHLITSFFILLFVLFTGCSSLKEEKLRIATNAWIGYAPLFYAQEKGTLKKLHIELVHNVSLAEAADIYSVAKADMVTTTQHEYYFLKKSGDIKPVILLDRSYGGDMILSNKTLQEIKNADKIDAYLEINSINRELLQLFIKQQELQEQKIRFFDKDQAAIQDIKNDTLKTILIVTYSPYDTIHKKKGFLTVASTREINSLAVIDALCIRGDLYSKDKIRLETLKKILDKAIVAIQKNPKSSHKLIAKYLDNISYKEFEESLKLIKWINHPSKNILKLLEKLNYEKEFIIL